ncbi:uncharacterized protein LOC114187211 [Vigna unguiculata]|uniref:uncharacterized protein LOC114187211 n=1 Tax=Vigna unguiculata TaxID=3917 RepID=UPI001016F9FC|nr:uncharacterized protein LOC114187211 [Vigna unguiculata]
MRKRTRNEANKENPEMKGSMMEELAKEELELLEAQYPNQHEYLKHELKSFIFQLQTKNLDSELLLEHNHCNNHFVFLDTEESTSLEGQKKSIDCGLEPALGDRVVTEGEISESSELETPKSNVMKHSSSRKNKRKDRVDLVLERAQVCLKKIKHLKTFLLSSF